MINTRLEIGTTDVATVENIPVPLIFQQSDLREPEKRNASFSKTIQLYGTNEINVLFESIYEVNIATSYFNPNLKTEAKYYVDESLIFKGYLQLLRITLQPDNNIVYDCSIVGDTGNLFTDIGDALLSDLDFSDLDEAYTMANIHASWDAAYGTTLYYPFINRGSVLGDESTWRVSDFLPAIYKYDYLMRILSSLGYTASSVFLETEFFKRQILTTNIEKISLTQLQLDNRQFYVGMNVDTIVYNANGQTVTYTIGDVSFPKETSPYFDAGANYTAPFYTVPNPGVYNFVGKLKFKITFTHTNVLALYCDNIRSKNGGILSQIKRSTGGAWSVLTNNNVNDINLINENTGLSFANDDFRTNFENNTPFYCRLAHGTGDVNVLTGDLIVLWSRIYLSFYRDYSSNPIRFYTDAARTILATGNMNIKIELVADTNTSFYGLVSGKDLLEGDTLTVNSTLPVNIKQRDFVKSLMQEFNLQIQPTAENPKLLIIEPYPDYYNDGVVDWENVIDLDKPVTIAPMSELDSKKFIYKYKTDKDYYNQIYESNFEEVFGTHSEEIENDFIKNERVNELIYSPTHNVANYVLGIAYPKVYSSDNGVIKLLSSNVRSLYAKKKTASAAITYKVNGGTDIITTSYGYAGHTDDPFDPTYDLNFGIPKKVYYSFLEAQFTDNNSFNRFHKPFIDLISHRDSKVVTASLWLKPSMLENFSFRKKYFIDGAYYLMNKIICDNATGNESIPCELIKLADAQVFTPTKLYYYDDSNYSTERLAPKQLGQTGNNIQINTAYPCIAIGEDIVVGKDAVNISVIGSNGVTVADGLSNVTVINSNNIEVTESDVSYTNGVKSYNADVYKVYEVVLNQSGAVAPTETINTNELGGIPVYSYVGGGDYLLTLTGAFPTASKVQVYLGSLDDNTSVIVAFRKTADEIAIKSTIAGIGTNGLITNMSLLIKVRQ